MSMQRRDRGAVPQIAIALLSLVLGMGAAAAAVTAVLSSTAPDDSRAVQTGPTELLGPAAVLNYGG